MIAQTEKKIHTVEEYLELELASETRSGYHSGKIIPMTGGTPAHNEIAINLSAFLKFALRGKPYHLFSTDNGFGFQPSTSTLTPTLWWCPSR